MRVLGVTDKESAMWEECNIDAFTAAGAGVSHSSSCPTGIDGPTKTDESRFFDEQGQKTVNTPS